MDPSWKSEELFDKSGALLVPMTVSVWQIPCAILGDNTGTRWDRAHGVRCSSIEESVFVGCRGQDRVSEASFWDRHGCQVGVEPALHCLLLGV